MMKHALTLCSIAAAASLSACNGEATGSSKDQQTAPPPPQRAQITLIVSGDTQIETHLTLEQGEITGALPCNRMFGTLEISADSLKVTNIGTTKKLCAPEVMALEEAALQILTEQGPLLEYADGEWVFGGGGDRVIVKPTENAE